MSNTKQTKTIRILKYNQRYTMLVSDYVEWFNKKAMEGECKEYDEDDFIEVQFCAFSSEVGECYYDMYWKVEENGYKVSGANKGINTSSAFALTSCGWLSEADSEYVSDSDSDSDDL